MTAAIIIVSLLIGFASGSIFRRAVYDSQDWKVFRWDSNIFGYRPLPTGSKVTKGDKVIIGLQLSLDNLKKDEEVTL